MVLLHDEICWGHLFRFSRHFPLRKTQGWTLLAACSVALEGEYNPYAQRISKLGWALGGWDAPYNYGGGVGTLQ